MINTDFVEYTVDDMRNELIDWYEREPEEVAKMTDEEVKTAIEVYEARGCLIDEYNYDEDKVEKMTDEEVLSTFHDEENAFENAKDPADISNPTLDEMKGFLLGRQISLLRVNEMHDYEIEDLYDRMVDAEWLRNFIREHDMAYDDYELWDDTDISTINDMDSYELANVYKDVTGEDFKGIRNMKDEKPILN